jgi:phospholipid-translocating P-type ATPase (flippase)
MGQALFTSLNEEESQSPPFRTIAIHLPVGEQTAFQRGIVDNSVCTTKYNILTFLPRSLFEQFRRTANVYFLVISVLMVIGYYTPLFSSPLAPFSTILPLVFVLGITMVKEGVEDSKRHRGDRKVNHMCKAEILSTEEKGRFTVKSWKDVRVGDIMRVHKGDSIPADMILLTSSELHGVAYVETSNIDGETNLKIRASAPTKAGTPPGPQWHSPEDLDDVSMTIEYEEPNPRIHFFTGTLRIHSPSMETGTAGLTGPVLREVALDQDNLLLRESVLRNCRWALGVVVYTGTDTKIVRNSRKAPSKQSNVDKVTNRIMTIIFGALAAVTTLSVIGYYIFTYSNESGLYYLCISADSSPVQLFRDNCDETVQQSGAIGLWFTFLILYNNFVPISLYVTLEIVNAVQAWYIENDPHMYDETQDTPAVARTSNMNGDLGQVEYIFSDKTGTLTQNIMKFKRCSVGGVIYGALEEKEIRALTAAQLRRAVAAPALDLLRQHVADSDLDGGSPEMDFALCLALNHTVVMEHDDEKGAASMQCESPDEAALVDGAALLGLHFVDRSSGQVIISASADGRHFSFALLATIPFDSTRKRMSVVVRSPGGRILLLCKGADNVILERASGMVAGTPEELQSHLSSFSGDGLRTLLLARRELSEEQYQEWAKKWHSASVMTEGRAEALAHAAESLEQGMLVLGATAIEDKLQDGVPATIADLGRAGVKLWVLTGDKMETAINIGYSCRLLEPDMTLIKLQEREGEGGSVVHQLEGLCHHFCRITEDESLYGRLWQKLSRALQPADENSSSRVFVSSSSIRQSEPSSSPAPTLPAPLLERPVGGPPLDDLTLESLALIVDGPSLTHVLGKPDVERLFLQVARLCRSVMACRVSPAQKRLIVNLVKRLVKPRPVTLAIGDGANDVGMIQEAQLGVGISGKEGRQAVNNADFAIAQFRFLKRLMLVHGHYNYRRLCKVILYSFYKNVCLVFVLFFFSFYTGFSGQSLFESLIYSGFNWFLAMPILLVGIFDKDVSEPTAMAVHRLYGVGIRNEDLGTKVATRWLIQSILDALLIFYLPMAAYSGSFDVWAERGYSDGIYVFGTTVYSCMILVMMLKVASITWVWNAVSVFFYFGSLALFFSVMLVYTLWLEFAYEFYYVAYEMISRSAYWLLLIQVPLVSWGVNLLVMWCRRVFSPTYSDHAIEFDRLHSPADLAAALKAKFDSTELAREAGEGEGIRHDRVSRKFIVSKQSLKELNEGLGHERLEELGMASPSQPRSSYAYDHVSKELGRGASIAEDEIDQILVQEGRSGLMRRQRSLSSHSHDTLPGHGQP